MKTAVITRIRRIAFPPLLVVGTLANGYRPD
jgi:hypothetical protein